jgi:hypothetical protein
MKFCMLAIIFLLLTTACAPGQPAPESVMVTLLPSQALAPTSTLPPPTLTVESTATQPLPTITRTLKPTQVPPTATSTPDPAVLAPLKGVYTTTMTEEDWLKIVAGAGSESFVREVVCRNGGQYTLTLGDGTLEFVQTLLPGCQPKANLRPLWNLEQGKFISKGKWTLAGELFMLMENVFHKGCSKQGEYTWNLIGDTLEFEYSKDECIERNTLFLTHPWKKIQ